MSELYHGIGFGDFLQVESYFTDDFRHSLKRIYWSGWAQQLARPCLDQIPCYRDVEHLTVYNPTDYHKSISSTKYHGVLHRLPFTGSSLLKHTLADVPLDLPDKYDFVHLTTPFNEPGIRSLIRDVKPCEWEDLIERLTLRKTVGVVVNSEKEPVPKHPRILDLTGLTTMPQAIEVLKRANGYTGIDSCFAILAAQLFAAEDLVIRTRNPWVDQYRWWFYAPHETFPFLHYTILRNQYSERPKPEPTGIFIELLKQSLIGNRVYQPHEVVEVTSKQNATEIVNGNAVPFKGRLGY